MHTYIHVYYFIWTIRIFAVGADLACQVYADINDCLVIEVQARSEKNPTKQETYAGNTQLLIIRTTTSPLAVGTGKWI